GYPVREHVVPTYPRCASSLPALATLEWRLAGDTAWRSIAMSDDLVPGWRTATIPPQPDGTRIEYRVRAVDPVGTETTDPRFNFDLDPYAFTVGEATTLFLDDFESDRGWTHQLLQGVN